MARAGERGERGVRSGCTALRPVRAHISDPLPRSLRIAGLSFYLTSNQSYLLRWSAVNAAEVAETLVAGAGRTS